jgi:hypothetical protein
MNPQQAGELSESMIRDTVAAVFSDPAYGNTSLLERLGAWLLELLGELLLRLRPDGAPGPVLWIITVIVGLLIATVVARTLWLIDIGRRTGGAGTPDGAGGARSDAWADARVFAARGDYTAAAHALYAAILDSIAGRGDIELHEAKTIGDYLRELATRSSASLARFRDFARSYETVIYGIGFCDRERFERLYGMAAAIVGSRG